MSRPFVYETTLSFGTDGEPDYCEIDVKVEFTVAWGSPETGNYGPPENYDPGSGDEIENVKLVEVNRKPRPWNMGLGFITDDEFAETVADVLDGGHHPEAMINEAIEVAQGDHEAAMEARAELRREDARGGF